jgi:hypothetical protein
MSTVPDQAQITGDEQIDADLQELFDLVDDRERLQTAKSASIDTSLSIDDLLKEVPAGVIRLALALLDIDDPEKTLASYQNEQARLSMQRALDEVKMHFSGVYTHPAVVRQTRRELARTRN